MIEWREDGVLIAARVHGETSAIVEVLTEAHGRTAGIVRGGASRKMAAVLQPGSQVDAAWKARLDDHLGSFVIEPIRSRAAQVLNDRLALSGLNAVCALLSRALPEREPHPPLYRRTIALMDLLGDSTLWPLAYMHWEIALLEELGFALDLSACAVRGVNEDLSFVSPRTGRAVSREGAGKWIDQLLPLPPVMKGEGDATGPEIARALSTTGYFITDRLFAGREVPQARARLVDLIAQQP